MRLHICAVGRLRAGPEHALIDDYLNRLERTGRALSLVPEKIREVEDKSGKGQEAEAALLLRAIPQGARIVALDERGTMMTSPELAGRIAQWRDDGCSDLAFVIGGADGLSKSLRQQADLKLSLGRMVWPHMLARVMLCEQLYRAASILAGSPYHRA